MRLRTLALAGLVALLAVALTASAHGRVCLQADGTQLDRGGHGRPGPTGATGDCPDGDLVEFVVGWTDEPPFVGVKNGMDLGIRGPSDNTPIGNVTTLNAQYEFGGRTFPLEVSAQFGRPGWYTDDIAPTRAGSYTLRVWGTLNTSAGAKQVNFTHQPAVVEPMGDIEFPEPTPDAAALQAKITALERQVAALQAEVDALKASPQRNGVVSTEPGTMDKGAPGFEPLLLLAALGAALVAMRHRLR